MIPSWPFSTIQQASISMFFLIISISYSPCSSLLEIRHPLNLIDPCIAGWGGISESGLVKDFSGLIVAATFSSSFLNLILDDACGKTFGISSLKHISFSRRFCEIGDPISSSRFFFLVKAYRVDVWDFNSVPLKVRPDSLLNWNSLFLSMTEMQSWINVELPAVQLLNFEENIWMVSEAALLFYC